MASKKATELLKMIAPEFKATEDVDSWIELVKPLVSEKRFGGQYEHAVALLAAHKMKLSGLGDGVAGTNIKAGTTQGLASVSEGSTSISFTTSGANSVDDEYSKTIYGLQFINLRKQCVICITIGN